MIEHTFRIVNYNLLIFCVCDNIIIVFVLWGSKMKNKKKRNIIIAVIVAIVLVAVAIGVYFLHPHNYKGTVVKESTCVESGEMLFKCWCGKSYKEPIPEIGHDYVATVTKEATCTEKGETTYTCSHCNDTYTEEIAVLGHDYVAETIEPTCTEDGKTTYTCSRCGDKIEDVLPATGHDYEVIKDDKTQTTYKCKICKDEYSEDKKSPAKKEDSADTGGGEVLGNGPFDLSHADDGTIPITGGVPDNIVFY